MQAVTGVYRGIPQSAVDSGRVSQGCHRGEQGHPSFCGLSRKGYLKHHACIRGADSTGADDAHCLLLQQVACTGAPHPCPCNPVFTLVHLTARGCYRVLLKILKCIPEADQNQTQSVTLTVCHMWTMANAEAEYIVKFHTECALCHCMAMLICGVSDENVMG